MFQKSRVLHTVNGAVCSGSIWSHIFFSLHQPQQQSLHGTIPQYFSSILRYLIRHLPDLALLFLIQYLKFRIVIRYIQDKLGNQALKRLEIDTWKHLHKFLNFKYYHYLPTAVAFITRLILQFHTNGLKLYKSWAQCFLECIVWLFWRACDGKGMSDNTNFDFITHYNTMLQFIGMSVNQELLLLMLGPHAFYW